MKSCVLCCYVLVQRGQREKRWEEEDEDEEEGEGAEEAAVATATIIYEFLSIY